MTKYSYDTQAPYIASFVILKQDGKIAFVKRANTSWMDGYYTFPSGKAELNESYQNCALREAQEETGVTVTSDNLKHVLTMHRFESNQNNWVDCYFEAEKWQGEPHNAEPEKASEFIWLDPKNLPDNIVPCVRFALEQIEIGNKYCEFNWEKA